MIEGDEGLIEYSRAFAAHAHGKQTYGELPYITHLDAVAQLVEGYGTQAIIIAYLHDTIEDTSVTYHTINQEFGRFIADCVRTTTDEPGLNRQEKKAKTYEKMSKVEGMLELALVVKAADRLVNMQASLSNKNIRLIDIYNKEYPVFREAVYRKGLCEDIWEKLDAYATTLNQYKFYKPFY